MRPAQGSVGGGGWQGAPGPLRAPAFSSKRAPPTWKASTFPSLYWTWLSTTSLVRRSTSRHRWKALPKRDFFLSYRARGETLSRAAGGTGEPGGGGGEGGPAGTVPLCSFAPPRAQLPESSTEGGCAKQREGPTAPGQGRGGGGAIPVAAKGQGKGEAPWW